MSDAKRAKPSDKSSLPMQKKRFLVTEKPHFLNGALRDVDWIGPLPEGVKPGKYLVEVDADGNPVRAKADEKSAKDKDQEGKF